MWRITRTKAFRQISNQDLLQKALRVVLYVPEERDIIHVDAQLLLEFPAIRIYSPARGNTRTDRPKVPWEIHFAIQNQLIDAHWIIVHKGWLAL